MQIYACGRRDIEAGAIDRRILAVIEFLSASGLKPDVSGLKCGHTANGSDGVDERRRDRRERRHLHDQRHPDPGPPGPGSITDVTVRRLLTLQGAMQPDEIVSLMSYKDQPTTLSMPDHANRIQITYTPLYGANKQAVGRGREHPAAQQWTQLINHISQIPEPVVPISPSKYAIKTAGQ